ncbi:Sugar kinase of the NBD/HSP70 family, may contain an N-terminal HTH domain [Streptomyces sp. SceaMP-e96]|uniref:ROK family transcriptional regulator n=1 Tax=unclassified Streptomyces TaxID=2593676 RepID=UPI000823AB30|nr:MULTISPECIES: ROK family transcriptional regulator [unclassified Streptomyces]MYT18012.1 ROK family protein [Streptomyces sp. SID4951]SCK50269.1 Sugar kinase of the NBD/HSP70 family, may contain an N-terminal HTH domain [Streptomyces sp. SceaMP-e96]
MHPPRAAAAGRTASPTTARLINDRLALQLLQSEGPLTAGQLKSLTGLSRPTVADLVERLQEAGLITVVGESGAQRRGPNARLYGIVADRAHLVGLDLRTHSVTVAVADLLGRVRAEHTVLIDPDGARDTAVATALAAVDKALAAAGAHAPHTIAVGAPGLVDPATGRFGGTDWIPSWHVGLVGGLRARTGVPVLLENEVNLAAIAEQRDGAAHDRDTFVLLWLGQGTGAAVVLDGTLRRGASGGTGEIGFLPVPGTGALPSASGCDGGFHSLAGSAAICALAAEHGMPYGAAVGPNGVHELSSGTGVHEPPSDTGAPTEASPTEAPPAESLVRSAVAAGDAGAAFLDALAARIALGVAAVCAVLDPGCVVLGGEIGRGGGAALADRVAGHLARLSPLRTDVRAGAVGGRAVLLGAVLAARDAAQNELFGAAGPGVSPRP